MNKLIIFLFSLSLLVASTVVFARPNKYNAEYQCKHIGIQKIKNKKFKNLIIKPQHHATSRGLYASNYTCPKYRHSEN